MKLLLIKKFEIVRFKSYTKRYKYYELLSISTELEVALWQKSSNNDGDIVELRLLISSIRRE